MHPLSRFRHWLRAKLDPADVASEIDEELRYHLEMRARDYRARGLGDIEAARAAEQRFGNLRAVRHECRRLSSIAPSYQGDNSMHLWLRDFRYALRSLAKSPGLAFVVLATLALGVGANTAIFSVIEGVLLRPLPYHEPDRLVMLWENDRLRGTTQERFSGPDFFDVRERAEVFEEMAHFYTPPATLTSPSGEPMRVNVALVSGNFFGILGNAPSEGRSFYPEEDEPGGNRVAVLSHELWTSRFGGDRGVLGRTIFIDGVSTEVIGVMGREFRFPSNADLWIPSRVTPTSTQRGNHGFAVVARLKPNANLEVTNANLEIIAGALEAEYTDDNQGRGMWAQTLYEASVGSVRTPLLVLLGAVVLVLLIACVNVANLLFARSLSRQQETAIRTAMGAGRAALLRQNLTEGLVLSLAGGALGAFVAYFGLGALLALVPSDLPRVGNVGLNGTVLVFALGISMATGLVFGLLPSLQISSHHLIASLREGVRAGERSGKRRAREILVPVEIALAVVLVIGAGLLMTSFWKILQVDPGFTPTNVVSVDITLPASRYEQDRADWPKWNAVRQFQDVLVETLASSPGVESAALGMNGPLNAGWTSRFTIEGRPPVPPGEQDEVRIRVVSPNYCRTLGIPILRGRPLESRDTRADAPPVILVNEAFARRYFVDEEPLGAHLTQWGMTREIVGIVQDVKFQGLEADVPPAIYPTFSQAPFSGFSLLVRTREEPEAAYARIREVVATLDSELALSSFTTLEAQLAASVAGPRFTMTLFGLFAGIALALAALGIYGVMSYSVSQRRHEIGVRMSLGAGRRSVMRLVLAEGFRLAILGVGLGIVGAALMTRTLESLLFGVERLDPMTFGSVAVLAVTVALAATYVPALRATRVDPIAALRHD